MLLSERFERDGYCVLDDILLNTAELDGLRIDADARVAAVGGCEGLLEVRCSAAPPGSCALTDFRPPLALQHGCVLETTQGCDASEREFRRLRSGGAAAELLFGARLRAVLSAVLGSSPGPLRLINEQFIVKPGGSSSTGGKSAFAWHRDGEAQAASYLSLWVALDDVDELNGCLHVISGSHTAPLLPPPPPGDEAGLPLLLNAGGAVLLHSAVLHRSGGNVTGEMRRAWMPQFAVAAAAELSLFPLALPLDECEAGAVQDDRKPSRS